MKKIAIFLCLLLIVTALYARAIQEDHIRMDEKARLSYAFGMAIGSNFDLSSMGVEFDYNAFVEGLRAIVEKKEPLFSEQEAMEIIEAALHNAMDRRAQENRMREIEFLEENGGRRGVHTTASGLQYEIIDYVEGGKKPKADSVVKVNYVGTFIDGSPFDSSTEAGGSYIPLDLVISGWTEGLMLMSPGSSFRFFIPSNLAYGRDGIQGIIPPYSTLIFTVELLDFIDQDNDPDYSLYLDYN